VVSGGVVALDTGPMADAVRGGRSRITGVILADDCGVGGQDGRAVGR